MADVFQECYCVFLLFVCEGGFGVEHTTWRCVLRGMANVVYATRWTETEGEVLNCIVHESPLLDREHHHAVRATRRHRVVRMRLASCSIDRMSSSDASALWFSATGMILKTGCFPPSNLQMLSLMESRSWASSTNSLIV